MGDSTRDISEERDRIDELAEEFSDRLRRGETPSISDYAARYPEVAERIRELFPTLAIMEQLKRQRRSGRPSERASERLERVGDFRVIREIGRGGMGIVYEATQESLDRHVALKVLPQHALLDPKRLQRFRREAHAAAKLHHTNIVPVFGFGDQDGLHYYVMQYIEGISLHHKVVEERAKAQHGKAADSGSDRARYRQAAGIGIQAADALEYAHEQGVLHRDIKPSNLILDPSGAVWITDFGLAKLAGDDGLTRTGDLIGTLQYVPAESLHGEFDRRGDVYGLGLTLYELLALEPAFADTNPTRLMRKIAEEAPPLPRKVNPDIPRDLETIVLKSIARDPGDRYQTAGEMAADLRRFLEDRPIAARRVSQAERLWRWCRRNRGTAALSATAAISLVVAAIVGWAGYAYTRDALKRESARSLELDEARKLAEGNLELSLEAFEEIFEALKGSHDDGLGGPRDGFEARPFAKAFAKAARGDREGPGRQPAGNAEDDLALLETILSFYDRYATANATRPRLQLEAARSYRRAAELHRWLDQDDEAEAARKRSAELFSTVVAGPGAEPDSQVELAEILAMAPVPEGDPKRLEASLADCHRAIGLCREIPSDSPHANAARDVHARALRRLGDIEAELGRDAEAELHLREAIGLWKSLAGDAPERSSAALNTLRARVSLAERLLANEKAAASDLELEAIEKDLRALADSRNVVPILWNDFGALTEDLAEVREIRDPARAESLRALAQDLRRRQPQGQRRGGRGGRPDVRPDGRPEGRIFPPAFRPDRPPPPAPEPPR